MSVAALGERVIAHLTHSHHEHHHHHTQDRQHPDAGAEGLRALGISSGILATTALLQALVVAPSGSVALLADTIHNCSDVLTAIPLGLAFVFSWRRRRKRHLAPRGLGRAEQRAGVFIVAMIGVSAAITAWHAAARLVDPQEIAHAGWVAVAGLVGFTGNELVAGYRMRAGRRIGSAALVADGLHARTDALTSLAVVGTSLGSLAGWRLADPVIGLVISLAMVNVLRIAIGVVRPSQAGLARDERRTLPASSRTGSVTMSHVRGTL